MIILGVITLDQISKAWALIYLEHGPVEVLGDFLRFSLVFNEGGAMGTSFGPSSWYLVVAMLVLPVLCFMVYRCRAEKGTALPLAFVIGGAAGNLVDRVRLGKVVDFIDVDFFDFIVPRWWTFNVADSAITCAIVFLLVQALFFHGEPRTGSPEATETSPDSLR